MNKDTVINIIKDKRVITLAAFCAAVLAAILAGIFLVHAPAVTVCVLLVLQVGISVLLNNNELWIHGLVILAEIIVGLLIGEVWIVVICALIYVAATVALEIIEREGAKNGKR